MDEQIFQLLDDSATGEGAELEQRVALGHSAGFSHVVELRAISVPGDPQTPNEDAFAVTRFHDALLVGVFDGTTSLQPLPALQARGLSSARLAARFLRHGLQHAARDISPPELLRDLNRRLLAISTRLDGADLTDPGRLPASSATIVKLDVAAGVAHLAHVYDSWCVAFYHNGTSELLTVNQNNAFDEPVLDLMLHLARAQGLTPREVRRHPIIEAALMASRAEKVNRADGSGAGIVNGDPNMDRYVQQQVVSLEDLSTLVLGTDGLLPQGWALADESCRQRLHELARASGGLRDLVRLKRESEDADPDWWHVRFKHSDDATGVAVVLRKSAVP